MPTGKKQTEWQKALQKVSQITDKIGMPLDEEIAETVVILYLLRFMTTGSCDGHLDRITEGPYVMLGSPKAQELEKQLKQATDRTSQDYTKLKDEIAKRNFAEQNKLFSLLKMFYASHKPILGRMLTLRTIGYSDFRLNCQGSELAYIEDAQGKALRLARNRTEMKAFTEWLKALYFESPSITWLDLEQDSPANVDLASPPTKRYAEVITELAETLERKAGIHVSYVDDSCFDGANGGPCIIFESPRADEVRKSVVAAKDGLTGARRHELYEEAMKHNVADQQALYRLLSEFYAKHDTQYERMLMVQTVGFSNFRLRHQGTDALLVGSVGDRGRKLGTSCDEMEAFSEYLK